MTQLSGYLRKMLRVEYLVVVVIIVGVLSLFWSPSARGDTDTSQNSRECTKETVLCDLLPAKEGAIPTLGKISAPEVATPGWLQAHEQAERRRNAVTVTYTVETRGNVSTSIEDFAAQAAETFADERGWSRMGVKFERVQQGGQFVLVLSEASQMTSFSATGCDTMYSCRVGQYVIINEDRWLGATDAWNSQGGSLRDYRHMVVNHETGHWLGHGHYSCPGSGQPAPVMQQQSIDRQGCAFNPWPVDFELTSSQLGV